MLKQFTGCITYDMLDEVVDSEAMETEGMDLGGLMMEFTDPGYNTKRECKADIRAAYKHWLKLGIMKPNKLRFLSSQVSEVELYADDEDRMMTERLHEEISITPNPDNYTAKEFEAVNNNRIKAITPIQHVINNMDIDTNKLYKPLGALVKRADHIGDLDITLGLVLGNKIEKIYEAIDALWEELPESIN